MILTYFKVIGGYQCKSLSSILSIFSTDARLFYSVQKPLLAKILVDIYSGCMMGNSLHVYIGWGERVYLPSSRLVWNSLLFISSVYISVVVDYSVLYREMK